VEKAKTFWLLLTFSKDCPKQTIAQQAKIGPICSPCSFARQRETDLSSQAGLAFPKSSSNQLMVSRVARFFFTQYTKTGKNIPKLPNNYQMVVIYSKWA
jgi:hypothetical protein